MKQNELANEVNKKIKSDDKRRKMALSSVFLIAVFLITSITLYMILPEKLKVLSFIITGMNCIASYIAGKFEIGEDDVQE